MANSTTGVLGLCSCSTNSLATTIVNYIVLTLLALATLHALHAGVGEVRGAKLEVERTIMEFRDVTEIMQIIKNDLASHDSTGTHLPQNITMSLYRRAIIRQFESLEGGKEEVWSKVGKFENVLKQNSLEQNWSEQKLEESRKRLQCHDWVWSRDEIAKKMTRLRKQSAKLLQLHASYVAERNTSTLERISRMVAVQETKLDASWKKLNILTEQQGSMLRTLRVTHGVPNDEILRAPSANVSRNENDAGAAPQESAPVFRESPVLALRDLLPVARK